MNNKTIAITSILDTDADEITRKFWSSLIENCQILGFHLAPTPHLSWQTADNYDIDIVDKKINQITEIIRPFKVRTAGFGIFNDETYNLFLNISPTEELIKTHKLLWELFCNSSSTINPLYEPGVWLPHISISFLKIDLDDLLCGISSIIDKPLTFEISISSIDLLYATDDDFGIISRHFLK